MVIDKRPVGEKRNTHPPCNLREQKGRNHSRPSFLLSIDLNVSFCHRLSVSESAASASLPVPVRYRSGRRGAQFPACVLQFFLCSPRFFPSLPGTRADLAVDSARQKQRSPESTPQAQLC